MSSVVDLGIAGVELLSITCGVDLVEDFQTDRAKYDALVTDLSKICVRGGNGEYLMYEDVVAILCTPSRL